MIRRIALHNFMSHVDTVIEPAEGLTVLVGPNNCGKSAVVAALQILCHNDASTFVMRHGQKECWVEVETDEGHVIRWQRRKSPSYDVDGEPFDRLRKGNVPPEVQAALRLPRVQDDSRNVFDVHFADQKSPIFLLDASDGQRALFFASASDAGKLLRMQELHRDHIKEARREKKRLLQEQADVGRMLERLEPALELDARVRRAEQDHAAIAEHRRQTDRCAVTVRELHRRIREQTQRRGQVRVLTVLEGPPVMHPVAELQALLQQMAARQRRHAHGAALLKSLAPLAPVPTLDDTGALERLIAALQKTQHQATHRQQQHTALAPLADPPRLPDVTALRACITALKQADRQQRRRAGEVSVLAALQQAPGTADPKPLQAALDGLRQAQATVVARRKDALLADQQSAEARDALQQWVRQNPVCPTCGADVDPARLLQTVGDEERDHASA